MPKYMIIGFSDGTEGVLEVVKAANVDDAREYITAHYHVADDLFEPVDQLPKSEFVLYDDIGHGLPAPAGLDWVDEGEMIHKVGLIRFSTDEQAEIRDLDAPQNNNNVMGQAGGRRHKSRRHRKAKRRVSRGTRHRK